MGGCAWGFGTSGGGTAVPGSLFGRVGGLGPAALFGGGEALAQVFSLSFAKFLRAPFLQSASGPLLLKWPN